MKKTNQNDLDLEMINLDETAGWNQLEIENVLAESKHTEDSLVFQGEITISEEELLGIGEVKPLGIEEEVKALGSVEEIMAYANAASATSVEAAGTEAFDEAEYDEEEYEAEYDAEEYEDDYEEEAYIEPSKEQLAFAAFLDEKQVNTKKKTSKKSSGKAASVKNDAKNSKNKALKAGASGNGKSAKGKKKKQSQTLWDKVAAVFSEMTVLDGVIAATGVIVLAVAIVTVSVFSSAKTAEAQIAAFAPIGEDMEYLTDMGKDTLLAMADSDRWIEAVEETEEESLNFEYEEKELEEVKTVNVNMKLTSVQKDLKIKFVNYKTGKLISNVPFKVSITDSAKVTKEEMQGI